jgi:Aspartyl protease
MQGSCFTIYRIAKLRIHPISHTLTTAMRTICRAISSAFLVLALAQTSSAQAPTQPPTATPTKLDDDASQLRYDDLALDLAATPPGPEHDLFAGVLADRTNHLDDALRLLTPLASDRSLSPTRLALVLGSLADANLKLFRYAQASALYARLLTDDPAGLSPALLKDDQDDSDTIKLLVAAPPQTIDITTPIDLPTHNDHLKSITADLTAHNITAPWILDTGANFSVVSETFARQLGLTLSTGVAHTQGATGAENPLHVAILDTLQLGTATVHNVVLLVLPDANLTIQSGWKSHVIPAILGYPVFRALGIIRFTHDHHFQAGPTLPLTGDSSPIYMEKLNILFSCRTHNLSRAFLFDSGADATTFFLPYYREFTADLLHQKQGTRNGYGAGGTSSDHVYIFDHVDLELANRIIDLQHVAVFNNPQNTLSDEYEGSLGRDLISSLDSLTLDLIYDRVYPGNPRN